jgi:hypothetical protein
MRKGSVTKELGGKTVKVMRGTMMNKLVHAEVY